jgi:hypothetical protein
MGWTIWGAAARKARAAALPTSAAVVRSSPSSTTTSWPARANISAPDSPAALPPITAIRTGIPPSVTNAENGSVV